MELVLYHFFVKWVIEKMSGFLENLWTLTLEGDIWNFDNTKLCRKLSVPRNRINISNEWPYKSLNVICWGPKSLESSKITLIENFSVKHQIQKTQGQTIYITLSYRELKRYLIVSELRPSFWSWFLILFLRKYKRKHELWTSVTLFLQIFICCIPYFCRISKKQCYGSPGLSACGLQRR